MNASAVAGLLLAAGGGRRFGAVKALVDNGSGPWVVRARDALVGLDPLVAVVGAQAARVRAVLSTDVTVVENADWASGMGGSLRLGLAALASTRARAVVVMLVDLPDVTAAVVDRLVDAAGPAPDAALLRAGYAGRPGHPVLIGRSHWAGVRASASGDRGARDYLAEWGAELVECGDLATGRDVDRPEDLP